MFRCVAVGIPRPSITWTSDSPTSFLYPAGYLDLYANETEENEQVISELSIHPVILADRGTYTCHAINREGEDDATVQLIVLGEYICNSINPMNTFTYVYMYLSMFLMLTQHLHQSTLSVQQLMLYQVVPLPLCVLSEPFQNQTLCGDLTCHLMCSIL